MLKLDSIQLILNTHVRAMFHHWYYLTCELYVAQRPHASVTEEQRYTILLFLAKNPDGLRLASSDAPQGTMLEKVDMNSFYHSPFLTRTIVEELWNADHRSIDALGRCDKFCCYHEGQRDRVTPSWISARHAAFSHAWSFFWPVMHWFIENGADTWWIHPTSRSSICAICIYRL